jgi:hypothetical protein
MKFVDFREECTNRSVLSKDQEIGNDALQAIVDTFDEYTLVFRQFV